MKFKIDENLPIEVADLLRNAKHDAITVGEQYLSGSGDPDIARICQQEKRALVTLDTDFADIRSYPPGQYSGIIVLRLKRQDKFHALNTIKGMIRVLANETLEQHLWIVEETRIRIRGGQ
jgi:predicted nuclease of predicted toxin-antitoxin system